MPRLHCVEDAIKFPEPSDIRTTEITCSGWWCLSKSYGKQIACTMDLYVESPVRIQCQFLWIWFVRVVWNLELHRRCFRKRESKVRAYVWGIIEGSKWRQESYVLVADLGNIEGKLSAWDWKWVFTLRVCWIFDKPLRAMCQSGIINTNRTEFHWIWMLFEITRISLASNGSFWHRFWILAFRGSQEDFQRWMTSFREYEVFTAPLLDLEYLLFRLALWWDDWSDSTNTLSKKRSPWRPRVLFLYSSSLRGYVVRWCTCARDERGWTTEAEYTHVLRLLKANTAASRGEEPRNNLFVFCVDPCFISPFTEDAQ